jgi:hypothetical protein
MFTKLDYYAAYLHLRVLHFNATECGSFPDYAEHFQALQAVERMRQDISQAERIEVEAEVDDIFNTPPAELRSA